MGDAWRVVSKDDQNPSGPKRLNVRRKKHHEGGGLSEILKRVEEKASAFRVGGRHKESGRKRNRAFRERGG